MFIFAPSDLRTCLTVFIPKLRLQDGYIRVWETISNEVYYIVYSQRHIRSLLTTVLNRLLII